MLYIVSFLAGAAIVAITLIVWYLDYVSKLRKLQLQIKARHDQQRSASQNLSTNPPHI